MSLLAISGAGERFLGKMIDGIGGVADDAFLLLPKLLKPFMPKREIDRGTYEQQVDFYFDRGYVDQPETFFQFAVVLPQARSIFHGFIFRCQHGLGESGQDYRPPAARGQRGLAGGCH